MSSPTPRKRFGQHFLESTWAWKLIDVLRPRPDDIFIEIGAGRGALTLPLAGRVAKVTAVEIDRDLAARLTPHLPPNVQLVTGDFLEADPRELFAGATAASVRVVGNLPYNLSTPMLFRLLRLAAESPNISDATLMLQKEVVDRLVAVPGSKDYGVLSILVRLRADVTRVLTLPPGAFRPPPRVVSAVVRLGFRPAIVPLSDAALFERLVRAIFTQRRKTIANALRPFCAQGALGPEEALGEARLDPRRRPETLEITELARLADIFASAHGRAML